MIVASRAVLAPLASSVRQVLSGHADGQSGIARAIAEPPGAPGWFTPQDAIWTVHGSVSTFVGGIRSLYLQALHPLALAGVDAHSSYREDPFGRLQRTGAFIAATTFGSDQLAQQTVDAIGVLHARVSGVTADGAAYSARDPRLLEWVHISLVDSMLSAYLRFGRDGQVDADRYVSDMAVIGQRMGVLDPPRSQAELDERFEGFRHELRVDDLVRATHTFVSEAPMPLLLRPGYRTLARAAWATQPAWALRMLDSSPRLAPVDIAAADAALRVLKVALVASPARLAGEQRLAAAEPGGADTE